MLSPHEGSQFGLWSLLLVSVSYIKIMAAVAAALWAVFRLKSRADSDRPQAGGCSQLLFYVARPKISLLMTVADLVAR